MKKTYYNVIFVILLIITIALSFSFIKRKENFIDAYNSDYTFEKNDILEPQNLEEIEKTTTSVLQNTGKSVIYKNLPELEDDNVKTTTEYHDVEYIDKEEVLLAKMVVTLLISAS